MPGPAGKSQAQKELEGNPGKRPIKIEPKIEKGAPKPPDDLKGEAFAEWCRVVPKLHDAGILSPVDRGYLVGYCEAWASFCEARSELNAHGPLITGRDGGKVRNPAAIVMKDSLDLMLKFGAKFGLSPQDRTRLATMPDASGPDDDMSWAEGLLS